jgi:hypothetical protein
MCGRQRHNAAPQTCASNNGKLLPAHLRATYRACLRLLALFKEDDRGDADDVFMLTCLVATIRGMPRGALPTLGR